jgi:hypothetical protein
LYFISSTHSTPIDYPPTCTALLFNESKILIGSIDVLGPKNDIRPWTCESTAALSFLDYYPDGSLKILALYLATALSSERFTVPVVIKLDYNKPSFSIDEALTGKFDGIEIETIKAARSIINKK